MRKEKPIYKQIETTGDVITKTVDYANMVRCNVDSNYSYDRMVMSPYSEYIPLSYLFIGKSFHNPVNISYLTKRAHISEELSKIIPHKHNKSMFGSIYSGMQNATHTVSLLHTIKELTNWIIKWMCSDDVYTLEDIRSHCMYLSSRDRCGSMVTSVPIYMEQRSYNALINLYSLIKSDRSRDRNYSPNVMAVILPENYLYMKYKLLTESVIDLNKVIILVDRELDTPKFESQPFRRFYKEFLHPEILKTSCSVWEVPLDYIRESCFMEEYSLKGMGVIERKKTIDAMVEGFKKYISEIGGNSTESAGIYDRLLNTHTIRYSGLTTASSTELVMTWVSADELEIGHEAAAEAAVS